MGPHRTEKGKNILDGGAEAVGLGVSYEQGR